MLCEIVAAIVKAINIQLNTGTFGSKPFALNVAKSCSFDNNSLHTRKLERQIYSLKYSSN